MTGDVTGGRSFEIGANVNKRFYAWASVIEELARERQGAITMGLVGSNADNAAFVRAVIIAVVADRRVAG